MEENTILREKNGEALKIKKIKEKLELELEEEEEEASVSIWKYVFGFTEMAVVKCAIELGIADVLETNGGSMSLSDLSSTLDCPTPSLYRIMRFLSHRKIFKQIGLSFTQTPLSRRLLVQTLPSVIDNSMAAFVLMESSPVMLSPWLGLSDRVLGKSRSAFEASHGEDVWSYAEDHPGLSKLINDAMACDARLVVPQIVKECPSLFEGVGTLVDVGGGNATTLSLLVDAFPWLHGINFDLPHVVGDGTLCVSNRVVHVGGDMFDSIPKADAVFLKWVLHDWGDEECIQILNKCKEAIAKDKGKVIIVEAVVADTEEIMTDEDKLQDARLMLDMVMMAHTTHGKERTLNEWNHLLKQAGFSRLNVHPIHAVQSVIVAYP